MPPEKRHPKLQILSVADIFGEAIRRNYLRQSIGDLFAFGEEGS
jgi:phosphoribosylpyrophosphate synthetase